MDQASRAMVECFGARYVSLHVRVRLSYWKRWTEDIKEERVEETKRESNSSHNLVGLTIEHKEDRFQEGRDVILTLKDTRILDDGEDVHMNVNMIDDEKGLRNIEMKKNLPGY